MCLNICLRDGMEPRCTVPEKVSLTYFSDRFWIIARKSGIPDGILANGIWYSVRKSGIPWRRNTA
jgi:hypothetical protein